VLESVAPRRRPTIKRSPAATAAIAEEDRAGVFTLRVGNLMPNEV